MAILDQHKALFTDYYELTMGQGYFLSGQHEQRAVFDYFFRKLPFKGGYVIFAGLHDLLVLLEDFRFQPEDIDYLRKQGFREEFLNYLESFSFRGDIIAAQEGEIIFPLEPVLRVEGTLLETQLVETILLNLLNFQSLIATKASRIRVAAGNRGFLDFGLRRAQGLGGIHASRASVIGGAETTSNVYSAMQYGLTPTGTMAHSWIESFDNELEAFRKFAEFFPDNSVFLVDTFNTLASGLPNAITVAKEMERKGHRLQGIRLDSGDLAYLSKRARAMLDEAGLPYVKIVASNQLDELIIKSLLEQGAPIDVFGVGTSLAAGREDGALDGVYKLSMFKDVPRLKISDNIEKVLLPGVKKIYRYLNDDGTFYADAVLLDEEDDIDRMIHPFLPLKQLTLTGMKKELLLQPVMKNGKRMIAAKTPYQIADYVKQRFALLPPEHKRFEFPHIYKVGISRKLMTLRDNMVEAKRIAYS
ncbi:MAG: nicotinate phosphoribosyltransferase [Cyclobacteriaceae bacterium]|jgi:nicotinate phosphoribosyltransferase|nr:nicotinate phosphoribosyltransferase [Cyclobacteriaceae bacterium]